MSLSCKPYYRQTVGTVVGNLEFHNGVVNTHRFGNVLSDNEFVEIGVLIENKYAVGRSVRKIAVFHTKLVKAAHHAEAFHPSELALLYFHNGIVVTVNADSAVKHHGHHRAHIKVLGGGNYLNGSVLAHVQLAYPQLFAVGMLFNLYHLADNNVFQRLRKISVSLYL